MASLDETVASKSQSSTSGLPVFIGPVDSSHSMVTFAGHVMEGADEMTSTAFVQDEEQPLASVIVTEIVAAPCIPAFTVTEDPVVDPAIVAFPVMLQLYALIPGVPE